MDNTTARLRRSTNNNLDDDAAAADNENNDNNDSHFNHQPNRFSTSAWHHSSRIVRVSRATGGKDRHSKVLTSKGLRDRRVRLSVSTAIQFYDLQDRLGYDQPSKAVEWLIKAAEDAIAELPSLDSKFVAAAENAKEGGNSDERVGFDVDLENDVSFQHHKSTCSSASASETSRGSVLSLSRSESRVKARERARERTAKDKDKEPQIDECECAQQHNSQNSSFTELLNSGGGGGGSPNQSAPQNPGSTAFFLKQTRPSPPMSMDYFSTGLFGQASSARNQFSSAFSSQPHFGIAPPTNTTMTMPPFNVANDPHPQHHHPELQQFSFLPDHLIPESQPGGGDYNLNFSISSSGLAGYNRGTLQSNSSSTVPPHFQRFTTSPADGSSIPFYIGNATASNAAPTSDEQFPTGFTGRLQLYYGDGSRHSDTKGKEKS